MVRAMLRPTKLVCHFAWPLRRGSRRSILFRSVYGTLTTSPTEKDAEELLARMNHVEGRVVTDPQVLEAHNTDWTNKYKGESKLMLRPKTTQEVSSILQYCNARKIGVVPQSGKTGLVGGSVPTSNEIILNLLGLNTIEGFDETNGILKCQAGCVLQDLQNAAATHNLLVPVDLGAKGSCCIGGNVSTNAGGQYYYRYGSLHANVLGLEVVLPNGQIMNWMDHVNRKDNTGYDLKHLFVGAEGTLGVITRVALHCPPLPRSRKTAFLACDMYQHVQQTLQLAKDVLGEILAAFEYMDEAVLDVVATEKRIPVRVNNETNYRYCVLIETHGSNEEHDTNKMETFLEEAMARDIVVDGILSQDLRQVHEMWQVRESCNPVVAAKGCVYKYDLSLPIAEFDDFVVDIRRRLEGHPNASVVNWGHVIDGNIHLNILTPGVHEVDPDMVELLEPFIFAAVIARGGSISAEHGLGQCKNKYLSLCKDAVTLDMMRSIKKLFDPNGIMNPRKYLP